MSVREQYDHVPSKAPTAVLVWVLIGVVIAVALGLWFVLPDSPVTVAVVFLAVLGAVFFGVFRVLTSRRLEGSTSGKTHRPGPGHSG